jgi:uncharacterized FlaG/YvyC family protein
MTEEEISSTGQFNAVGVTDLTASYQPSSNVSRPVAGSTAAAPANTSAASASAPTKSARQPTSQEIATAVAAANANLASSNRELDYRVDAATGISVALIRNSQTGVVVQQIPGADIIALAKMLADWAPGKHMMLDLIA